MNDIKPNALYSINEIEYQKLSSLSPRYVQRYAKKVGIKKIDNGYKFYGFQITRMNDEYTTRHAKKEEKSEARLEARLKKEENTPPLTDGKYTGADEDTIEISVKDYDNIQRTIAREDIHLNKIEMLTQRVEEYQIDVKYFKDTLTEALSSMKESLKSIQQQNYIQAKEKGFDKK